MMKNRRLFLLTAVAAATGVAAYSVFRAGGDAAGGENFEFALDDAEWRKRLGDRAYAVLRREATEPPYTSDLLEEKRAGLYVCAGCDLELYASDTKFDSGTGWPSFYEPIEGAVSRPGPTTSCCCRAPKCIAGAAAAISDTSSTTARRRPESVTASTASRLISVRKTRRKSRAGPGPT